MTKKIRVLLPEHFVDVRVDIADNRVRLHVAGTYYKLPRRSAVELATELVDAIERTRR